MKKIGFLLLPFACLLSCREAARQDALKSDATPISGHKIVEVSDSSMVNYHFPRIPNNGNSIRNFVPQAWEVRDSVTNDFNGDHLQDWAVVIQTRAPFALSDTIAFSNEPFYPKMLLLLFKQIDGSLALSTIATKIFGQNNWGVQGHDPFVYLSIRGATLGVDFFTGGTERQSLDYYFRFQNNDWYLIGAESEQYWAGHTDGPDAFFDQSANFITGEKVTLNRDENDKESDVKKTRIKKAPLVKLTEFNDETDVAFDRQ